MIANFRKVFPVLFDKIKTGMSVDKSETLRDKKEQNRC